MSQSSGTKESSDTKESNSAQRSQVVPTHSIWHTIETTCSVSTSYHRVWVQFSTSRRTSRDLLCRPIPLLRRNTDLVVLPDTQTARECFSFYCELLGLAKTQALFIPERALTPLNDGVRLPLKAWIEKYARDKPVMLIPYTHTQKFSNFAASLGEHVLMYSEVPESTRPYMSHRGPLTRLNPAKPDVPSWLEDHPTTPPISHMRSYLARNRDELLRVAKMLDKHKTLVIKPIASGDGRDVLFLPNQPSNLRFYDFSNGSVCVEAKVDPDLGSEGFVKNFTAVTFGSGTVYGVDQLILGTRCAGIRSVRQLDETQKRLLTASQSMLAQLKPRGPITVEYLFEDGLPLCSDVNPGRFAYEHFALLFNEMYGGDGIQFMCVNMVPPEGLDVWTFWSRLQDHDHATFNPRQTKGKRRGIFPLLYLRGTGATFMLFGETDQELQALRTVLEESLAEPVTTQELRSGEMLDPSIRRIWCLSPRPETLLRGQRNNLPVRYLYLMRPKLDLVILPGGHQPTMEYVDFIKRTNGVTAEQIIYTSGQSFCMDEDIDETVVSKLKAIVTGHPEDKFVFVPYTGTQNFYSWANQFCELGVSVFSETAEWLDEFGHKGILHRHMSSLDTPGIVEAIDPKIRVAKGYGCDNSTQLVDAYRLIGSKDVVIKPIYGSAGAGIVFVNDEQQLSLYDFKDGPVILEEALELDVAEDGNVVSPAHHYMRGDLIGMDVDQIMMGTSYAGWRESSVSPAFKKTAMRYTRHIVDKIKPQGPGGFDFLAVGGKPVLSDVNTGRFNGAHQPKLFVESYCAKDAKWICWKHKPDESLKVHHFWQRLLDLDIAYISGKSESGVFPLLFQRGVSGMFIAIAPTMERVLELQAAVTECLAPVDAEEDETEPIGPVPTASFKLFNKASTHRIWAHIPAVHRELGSETAILCRPIALLRPDIDLILLPTDPIVREFFEFCCDSLGIKDSQASFSSSSGFEGKLDTETVKHVRDWVATNVQDRRVVVVPYQRNSTTIEIVNMVEKSAVFCDAGEDRFELRHHCATARSAADPNTPSWLEVHPSEPPIPSPRTYLCRGSEDLVIAGELLSDCTHIVLKPVHARNSIGMLTVPNKAENLRFYDFRFGHVVVEPAMKLDLDSDGLVRNFTAVSFGTSDTRGVEQLLLGTRLAGIRSLPTHVLNESQSSLLASSQSMISQLEPRGPITVEYLFEDGKALCTDVNPGRFSFEHFALLFNEMYGDSEAQFMCVNIVPPEGLDVWTFWSRLQDHDHATFNPRQTKGKRRGIFPLLYLRGTAGTFMLFGDTDQELQVLRTVLEESLAEPVTTQELRSGEMLDPSIRRIWCLSPRPESLLRGQRYNLPVRFLYLMRADLDIVLLPGGHQPTMEYVDFIKRTNGVTAEQIIYTSGQSFCMDEDIDETVVSKLKAIITSSPEDKFVFVPYTGTQNFYSWANQFCELGVSVFSETAEWLDEFGHKGILHRHMSSLDTPGIVEAIDPKIRVAKGYGCDNPTQLVDAYRLIGSKDVVIKPIYGSSGAGIVFVNDEQQLSLYDFKDGPVILEEALELDVAEDGNVVSPAHHYMRGDLIGMDVDQIMMGTSYAGWRESSVSPAFKKTAMRYIRHIVDQIKPQGPGGFDFLAVGGKPVLSDVNTGRFNGAHQPKLFVESYCAKDAKWICWKHKPDVGLDVHSFFRRLEEAGVAFIPGKSSTGVYPLLYQRGSSGMFLAVAANDKTLINMQARATKLLEAKVAKATRKRFNPHSALDPPPPPASDSVLRMILVKNACIYAPELLEVRNVIIAGEEIVGFLTDDAVGPLERMIQENGGEVLDAENNLLVPGFVDIHMHLCGGGGELGFHSQTPACELSQLINAGTTTVVGVLGTDSITRSPESLLAKVEAINSEGLTAFMYTGAYRVPAPTITGSVMKDVAFIRPCIGVGEVAISDHRGSQTGTATLAHLGSEARVGGLLSGKAGIVYAHVGHGDTMLKPLWDVIKTSDVPITQFLPTHMSRNWELIEDGMRWVKAGGFIDITARDKGTCSYLTRMRQDPDMDMERVICSSDAFGSLPTFDAGGNLLAYRSADPSLLRFIKIMYFEEMWPLDEILPLITSNPATYMQFKTKGHVEVGLDADLLVLDRHTLSLKHVIAKGKIVKTPGYTKRGFMEGAAKK